MKVGRTYTILASLLLALAYAGCGDDAGGPSKKGCTTNDDCSGATVCVAGTCQPAPDAVTGDTGGPDDTAAPEDPGTEPPKDVVVPEDQKTTEDPGKPFDPGPAPDLIPDTTDPDVKEVTPADGAVNVAANVKIKLVFTEPVKNVVSNSIELTDPSGTVLELQITKKCGDPHCAEWEVTPKAPLWLVSPYVLTVNFPHQVIMDQAGNKMEGIREYEFFTAPPPDLGKYDALAKKYAPVVRLTTESATKAHLDIPHKIDFDGNWDVKDNVASLDAAKELVAAGYYSVLESESHVFIHYFWFWSRRENPAQGEQFDSDSSGALVVLAKWPEEKPVEVMTWFKKKGGDYVRAFVTKESGILPEGTDKANAGVDGVYPLAELFP